ncbi:hypothetical protein Skr01_05450 [Sphaerisporangium krabiense]|uniref:Putative membrane protein YkoI n=1 Tax=Sphaerisporangium krabiense TaxID=763782 RepID=A0A7W8Z7C9_9ACTN|nr:PepSY domain-containing protein [Sphaerisporangium krabiense]MBB5628700.1 putative membrane protein YkoI [Sphaerisporangium krabiense]GII60460.1 hypothetical protein Skr01_05450 [Sphaerisporangium krabiense]
MTNTTNTRRIGAAARLLLAGAGALAVLGAGALPAAATAPAAVPAATTTTATASSVTGSAAISARQAVRIAKKRVPGARVTEVEREWEHGQRVWKVELTKRHTEYDVYVSARTGKIVKFRQDHDD